MLAMTIILPLCPDIQQFEPAMEQWTQYVEQLEQFSFAKKVTGYDKKKKKRATFVSVIGRDTYNIFPYSSYKTSKKVVC